MRRMISAASAIGLIGTALASPVAAQSISVYAGPPPPRYSYVEPRVYVEPAVPPTRVYGYYRRDPIFVQPPAAGYGSCGVYHYFDGYRCVDARRYPPDLN